MKINLALGRSEIGHRSRVGDGNNEMCMGQSCTPFPPLNKRFDLRLMAVWRFVARGSHFSAHLEGEGQLVNYVQAAFLPVRILVHEGQLQVAALLPVQMPVCSTAEVQTE